MLFSMYESWNTYDCMVPSCAVFCLLQPFFYLSSSRFLRPFSHQVVGLIVRKRRSCVCPSVCPSLRWHSLSRSVCLCPGLPVHLPVRLSPGLSVSQLVCHFVFVKFIYLSSLCSLHDHVAFYSYLCAIRHHPGTTATTTTTMMIIIIIIIIVPLIISHHLLNTT